MAQRPAHFNRLARHDSIESSCELHPSQDSKRIFGEMFAGRSQYALLQVRDATVWIDKRLVVQVTVNGVHREIATKSCFGNAQRVIHFHLKTTMPVAYFALSTRQREIEIVPLRSTQFNNTERNTNLVDTSKTR